MSPHAVTLIFDLSTRKTNQYVSRSRYTLVKLAPIVTKIAFTRFSGSSPAVALTFDLLIPKSGRHI